MGRSPAKCLPNWSPPRVVATLLAVLHAGGCIAYGYGDVGPPDAADAGATDAAPGLDEDAETADKTDGRLEDAATDVGLEDGGLDAANVDTGTDASPEDAGSDAAMDADADQTDAAADTGVDAKPDGGDASSCVDGCVLACDPGWGDCDGMSENGCEADLTSIDHCGACGEVCSPNGGSALCAAGTCGTRCDLSGTFALKLTVQAAWPVTNAIAAGAGSLTFWLRVRASQQDTDVAVELLECGRTVPPFGVSQLTETHLFYYSDSLFDAMTLPETPASITLGDNTPDASLHMPRVPLLLGIDMSDPANDPWPSTAAEIPTEMRLDMDGDGDDGIPAHYSGDADYVYPRTSNWFVGYSRAEQVSIATRVTFSLEGALTSCSTAAGPASFGEVKARIYACRHPDGTACTAAEAEFLDGNLLQYALGEASYELTRVTDGASCAVVRSALP